jgi:(1->4)-alpha-D-glucan 1-alpha-D-glucosylmutase
VTELVATYRLQLGPTFGFDAAAAVIPDLAALGVSHVYTSPVTEAVPGSPHGYDVVDHQQVREELGGDEALRRLWAALRRHGLGHVVDLVPNHMAADHRNRWWWDVLAHGRSSAYAGHFDIDWDDPAADGRLVLPVLDRPLPAALADGVLGIGTSADGTPVLRHHDRVWPLRPDGPVAGDPAAVVAAQHYEPVFWRDADTRLNYRRFFDLTDLVAVPVDRPDVFADVHRLLAGWMDDELAADVIDGVRVDHVDGIADPAVYLTMLRGLVGDRWIVVEKILAVDERLPPTWPVDGTTGYDAMADVTAVLVDPAGEAPLAAVAADLGATPTPWRALVDEARRRVLRTRLHPELRRAARAWPDPETGDPETGDQATMDRVADLALATEVYRAYPGPDDDPRRREFAVRLAHVTAPLAAKAVEDTAFYRDVRLPALDEVGGDPGRFGLTPDGFHARMADAAARRPRSMVVASTHDTKRSADVRARLAVISERPEEWRDVVRRWRESTAGHRRDGLPDDALDLFVLANLVGAWPVDVDRAVPFALKAAREAKRATSWIDPDPAYEKALTDFLRGALDDRAVVDHIRRFVAAIGPAGRVNAMATVALTLTTPGVPDLYQGDEQWCYALVDPDNRRPVDPDRRRRALARLSDLDPAAVWSEEQARDVGDDAPGEGLAKLLLVHRLLRLRRAVPEAFRPGAGYEALPVAGPERDHLLAYRRARSVVVVVPRLPASIEGERAEAAVRLPRGTWHDVVTGAVHEGGPVGTHRLFAAFPVSVLTRPPRDD